MSGWRLSLLCVASIGFMLMGASARADAGSDLFVNAFASDWPRTDFSNHTVSADAFLSGGPVRDGIPPIDAPQFEVLKNGVATGWARNLAPEEPVIVVSLNGETRAYPLEIMLWHEIVNDTVGGVPVAVTYCPLCNAALAFRREVDGKLLDFGTTGLLRKSNLVMYDRQTESWWQQFEGRAVVGTWAGTKLTMISTGIESFADYARENPAGKVLVPSDPAIRPYGQTPYLGYDSNRTAHFLSGEVDTSPLEPMGAVVMIRGRTSPLAISEAYLREAGTVTVDGLTITWQAGMSSVLDTRKVRDGRDVGKIKVLRNENGVSNPVPYSRTFAFVFRSFFPGGLILDRCDGTEGHPDVDCHS